MNEAKASQSNSKWYLSAGILIAGLVVCCSFSYIFREMGYRWVHIFIISALLSATLTPLFEHVGRVFGILDIPDSRKDHAEVTPLLGGVAIAIAVTSALLINEVFTSELKAILVASGILLLTGLADDVREVPAALKLSVQLACTALVIRHGIVLHLIPSDLGTFSDGINLLLTAFWVIGITNAMNFIDGMDGLASGVGAIIAFFLGVVAFQTSLPIQGWIAAAVMGGCLGFLPYNFRMKGRARIFLGDAGSTFLGFMLACLAVYGEWAPHNPFIALISPMLIFWVLIFDMVHITVDRIITGKVTSFREWIEYVGRDHLHHRLAEVLGGPKRSVMFIYLLSFCLGTSAVILRHADTLDAFLLLLQACVIVSIITVLERRGRSLRISPCPPSYSK